MNDGMLLQINRQRNLIPEDRLKAAQTIQESERAEGKPPRALLDILATRGDLDSDTVHLIRRLMHKGATNRGNRDATVADGFHAVVESVLLTSETAPAAVSKTGWPQEVLDAEQDMKNLFGQFVLVAQVGSGGSGTVFRAWDRRVSRYAGLKILHTMEPSALERFTREARIAGNLQHPSIATIYEVGEQDGRYYIAMKYIDGRPIDADPRSIPECLGLIRDACRALHYAHEQGVIHRDIKPANLLVDGQDRVYVTDFGIAKQASHEHTSTLSMTGTIIGTPKYLPPEQARGEAKRADARSDVYSIGATLYTLLAGRAPFPSSNVWETLESVMKREPPPLTSLNAAVSPELERIIAKAMAKDPAARFSSAGDLAEELDRILRQRRYTGRYGLIRYLTRKWVWVAAAGILMGLLIHRYAGVFFPVERPNASAVVTADSTYKQAAQRLLNYLIDHETISDPKTKIATVMESVGATRKIDYKYPYVNALLGRMHHASGNWSEAARLLGEDPDYRARFTIGLMELEGLLDKSPPPLPLPEDPSDSWPDLDVLREKFAGLKEAFKGPPGDRGEPLALEAKDDAPNCLGLLDFVSGNWDSKSLQSMTYSMPVFRKARHRATYMARQWKETLEQGAAAGHQVGQCPECFGARLATALAATSPIPAFEKLRADLDEEQFPKLELLLNACLARRRVECGLDPESVVVAGEALPVPGRREERGVLWAARLRWMALSGRDTEDQYNRVLEELGSDDDHSTPMGLLAKLETLIGRARRQRLRSVDAESFNATLSQIDKFVSEMATRRAHMSWIALRILQAESFIVRGDYEKAFVTLPPGLKGHGASEVRANLVAAEAQLRTGNTEEAKKFAALAIEGAPNHPVAHRLRGAAYLEYDLATPDPTKGGVEALGHLDKAVGLVPEYVEARFERARALLLIADRCPLSALDTRMKRLIAIADLTFVLERFPTLKQAETLRAYLQSHLNVDASSKAVPK